MQLKITTKALKIAGFTAVLAAVLFFAFREFFQFKFQSRDFYTIGVFYNSVNLHPDDLAVIKFIVGKKVEEINREGGIGGRRIQIRYLDDKGSREEAYKKVKATIKDENLIAYLGSWGTTRVQAVAELVGNSGVPYIGGYSVTGIAKPYTNMFSYEIGVNQVAFVAHKLLQAKASKVALISNKGDIFSDTLFNKIKQLNKVDSGYKVVMEKWIPDNHKFKGPELEILIDSLRQQADFLLLSTNPGHTNSLLAAIGKHKLKLPVFTVFTDIPEVNTTIPGFSQLELYDASIFGIPSALNIRCQELEAKYKHQLKESSRLEFQLGLGGLHADAIGLLKEAYLVQGPEAGGPVRQRITNGLAEYIAGKRIYIGWFSDWYFNSDRGLVNEVLLSWKPQKLVKPVLAPVQYLRADSGLQLAPVLYTTIDLTKLEQVSDRTGTFNASFYLEIQTAEPFKMEQLVFINAVRNEINRKPLLSIEPILTSDKPGKSGFYQYLYRIGGQFFFKPDFRKYPFDKQRFSITLQTNSAFKPFLIQPPGNRQRDVDFKAPGWNYNDHLVGFDQDVIYTASNILKQQTHVPYYKFSYTYVLKRTRVDFFLKVLIPLLVLVVVTYFSAFVPIHEFVSVIGIQVTALLSAIALYFSAYKPAMAFATISDKIFIFIFVMITTLIGATVLQYWLYRRRKWSRKISVLVAVYERILFPIIVIGFTLFLLL